MRVPVNHVMTIIECYSGHQGVHIKANAIMSNENGTTKTTE